MCFIHSYALPQIHCFKVSYCIFAALQKHSLQFKLLTIPLITGGVAVVDACAAPRERHLKWDKQ